MGYGELERCNDFSRLSAVFDDGMLKYFQRQLEEYLEGADERPAVVCWDSGAMSTDEFIETYNFKF